MSRYSVDATHSPRVGRLRIVHISDVQSDGIGDHERAALRAAMAARPDLIALTGDYVQERFGAQRQQIEADLRRALREEQIYAPLGIFAVGGNADRDWPAVFSGSDVTCLNDEVARVRLAGGRSLALIGLSLRSSFGQRPERSAQLLASTPESDVRVVLGHAPDFVVARAGRRRVDLALAGHTHGGQVALPLVGPPVTFSSLPRQYAAGLHSYGGVRLHVSSGVGMERGYAPQLRFLCPPEIAVLDVDY